MTYGEQLLDPRWQRRRLDIMQRDEFKCVECGDATKTLHVDHRVYFKGRLAWEYPDDELQTLCKDCHRSVTGLRRELELLVAQLDERHLDCLVGYASGLAMRSGGVLPVRSRAFALGIAHSLGNDGLVDAIAAAAAKTGGTIAIMSREESDRTRAVEAMGTEE